MTYDLTRKIFTVCKQSFSYAEFLEALQFYGLYEDWELRVKKGKQLVNEADKKGLDLDIEMLSEMSNDFRYSEKLLTSEEFNDYLEQLGLNLNDFESFLKRSYWNNELSDEFNLSEDIKAEEREILSEIHFSGAFRNLQSSWMKRLLAWFDENEEKAGSMEELESHFQKYRESLDRYFDKEQWIALNKKEFSKVSMLCLAGDREILVSENFESLTTNSNLQKLPLELYRKDIPPAFKEFVEFSKPGDEFGPLQYKGENLVCRLESLSEPCESDEVLIEELRDEFEDEVWKTLRVKYVG